MNNYEQKLTRHSVGAKAYKERLAAYHAKEVEERRQRAKTYAYERAKNLAMTEEETSSYVFGAILQAGWDYNEGRPYTNPEPIVKDTYIQVYDELSLLTQRKR